ncbi:hypothetical protein BJ165DRAFT_1406432 [Panaeolus papilionaceus]|nr:hypothetical protein BJ165DRAFT_1406432 [Panaeolus papilionaceus]
MFEEDEPELLVLVQYPTHTMTDSETATLNPGLDTTNEHESILESSTGTSTIVENVESKFAPSTRFFFDTIDFVVEKRLFRVPRIAFEGREGSPFAAAAGLQSEGANQTLEGGPTNPVHLPVSKKDFDGLCQVLFRTIAPGASTKVWKEEWKSAMRLANMWNFKDIRKQAKTALNASIVDAQELIICGREPKVSEWFRRGGNMIATSSKRFHPINSEYAKSLGIETASKLLFLQLEYYRDPDRNFTISPTTWINWLTKINTGVAVDCPNCKTHGRLCHDDVFADGEADAWKDAKVFPLHTYARACTMNSGSSQALTRSLRKIDKTVVNRAADKLKKAFEKEFESELKEIERDEECYD